MSAALVTYGILGPGLWALLAIGMAFSFRRLKRLEWRQDAPKFDAPPSVTVLIPAKDEGEPIRACLDAALALDYPNFRIVAINDRSGDQTGAIMDQYAAAHPARFQSMHITDLPAGWLGKCNALATAAGRVESEWILFVDSDVTVEPNALSVALAQALERGFDAISIMPRLKCESIWEHLLLPLCAGSVGAMSLMLYTNNDHYKSFAFANGQFILVRRSAYENVGGHGAVRDQITEDVALFRQLKAAGHRIRVYFGRKFAATRMHATLGQMFHGWARIFSGVTNRRPWSILAAMLFTLSGLAAFVAAAIAVMTMNIPLAIVAAVHLLLLFATLGMFYHLSAHSWGYALLFPLAGPMMLAIYAFALRACHTGKIAWRGTSYAAPAVPHVK